MSRDRDIREMRRLVKKYAPHALALLPPPNDRRKADPLPQIEMMVRVAWRERGMSRTAALTWLADAMMPLKMANSTGALVARWRRKLIDEGYTRRSLKRLALDMGLPPHIDPSRFTMRPTLE